MLAARRLYEETNKLIQGDYADVQTVMFGPFEAPVYRVDNKFRMRMVVKCRLNKRSRALFSHLLTTFSSGGSSGAVLSVDFNPSTL
jgi:primosomal protein N'